MLFFRSQYFLILFFVLAFSQASFSFDMKDDGCSSVPCDETLENRPIPSDKTQFSLDIPAFEVPPTNYELKHNYSYLDPHKIVPQKIMKTVLKYYEYNLNKLRNANYITLVDFRMHASQQRMFVVDMRSGQVKSMLTAAGRGSDPDGDGYATIFSNIPNSLMSSLGFYLTAEEYIGSNGRSLRLHGLSKTNSNAFNRYIVVHGSNYVSDEQKWAGRSHGCPAVDKKNINELIDQIEEGSLLYISY